MQDLAAAVAAGRPRDAKRRHKRRHPRRQVPRHRLVPDRRSCAHRRDEPASVGAAAQRVGQHERPA